ncbi:hypothetical protein OH817_08370 [Kocuria rhizophila]|uniref:ApeA N-terminal domain 1-containing protein n=1 Tax=Kocuria rhizophila TaxID=72000 RepID=UPI002ED2C9BD|nr:hypothetical protein OH817_08370 [Kocuria rhizophila]
MGIVEVLGASRGKSPLIIGDLDVYPQLPRITGAPTLNSEEPVKVETRVAKPRGWGDHLHLHGAVLDLVSLAAWKPFGFSSVEVIRLFRIQGVVAA